MLLVRALKLFLYVSLLEFPQFIVKLYLLAENQNHFILSILGLLENFDKIKSFSSSYIEPKTPRRLKNISHLLTYYLVVASSKFEVLRNQLCSLGEIFTRAARLNRKFSI